MLPSGIGHWTIRLSDWCNSVSMEWVQTLLTENANLPAQESNSNTAGLNIQTYTQCTHCISNYIIDSNENNVRKSNTKKGDELRCSVRASSSYFTLDVIRLYVRTSHISFSIIVTMRWTITFVFQFICCYIH